MAQAIESKSGREHTLRGKTVAILVADGFEEIEMTEPRKALEEAGANTVLVCPGKDRVRAWNHTEWSKEYDVDIQLETADAEMFDALLVPGGVMSPDKLRENEFALSFIRSFTKSGKPIAAICHGPWVLINAEAVSGRKMTSYGSLRADLLNAGARWVNEEVVVDNGLVTSRNPDDLPAFNRKMLEEFAEGVHAPHRIHRGAAEEARGGRL